MTSMFLLYESVDQITFENFQLGIDDLISIEKDDDDRFYKNSSLDQVENYYELYEDFSQDNQFRAEYLEKLIPSEFDPNSIEELSIVLPNKVAGFFGINFPQLGIDENFCVHNDEKFRVFKKHYFSLIDCTNFSFLKEDFFPNIVFCGKAEEQLKAYGKGKLFYQCLEQLKILENYSKDWNEGNFSYRDLNATTAINLSPESNTTMNKYRAERVFSLPNGKTAIFELHIKLGEVRIHILEDNTTKKIMVGYIGKHLSI